jgi:ABC-type lipoprotein export system ATPase subunit
MTLYLLSLRSLEFVDERGLRPRVVLSDLSLELEPGEQLGIWGLRRSGKTTLLNIAAGRMRPHAGGVFYRGRDVYAMSDGKRAMLRRHEIGYVERNGPKQRQLPIREWVVLSGPAKQSYGEWERAADELFDRVGLEPERCRLRWDELSDSERALAAIAQALMGKPSLLIADDPTAALDKTEANRVALLLRVLADNEGVGMIVSAPELGLLRYIKRWVGLSAIGLTETRIKDEGPGADVRRIDEGRRAAGQ